MSDMLHSLSAKWVFDASRDPPVYTRPLVGSELLLHRYASSDGDGEACMGIDFTSSLGKEELRERTRKAIEKLRFVCPTIACTIEDATSPQWVYTPSNDREAWLNLALVVEERGTSLRSSEFARSLSLTRLPYTDGNGTITYYRAYLLVTSNGGGDESKEYGLYFHGSHSIGDAIPAVRGLALMSEWISGEGMDIKIEPSEEWKNLAVDPITATGGPLRDGETVGTKLLQDIFDQNTRTVPLPKLAPPSRPLNMSDLPFHYVITVSESETAAVISQTKKLGVSVSALFHAALCLAQIRMNPDSVSGHSASEPYLSPNATVVSLERYLKPPYNARTHLISLSTLMPLHFSIAQPLLERSDKARLIAIAKLIQDHFDRQLVDPYLPHLSSMIADMSSTEMEQDDTKLADQMVAEETASSPWCCTYYNLGVVENKLRTQLKKITIGGIYTSIRLKHCMAVHMWTMNSKFHLKVQGNLAWGEECIRMLLDEMLSIALLVLESDFEASESEKCHAPAVALRSRL